MEVNKLIKQGMKANQEAAKAAAVSRAKSEWLANEQAVNLEDLAFGDISAKRQYQHREAPEGVDPNENMDFRGRVKAAFGMASPALLMSAPQLSASPGYISTPYEEAYQSTSTAAIEAVGQVQNGAMLYRFGTLGKSGAAEAQFWSLENPANYINNPAAFAERFGIPAENLANGTFFIEAGNMKSGAAFITREAPGVGANAGGSIEVVTSPGSVQVQSFNTFKAAE